MKFGIHYHIPAIKENDSIHTNGFFGVFLDSIANEVDELHVFLHSPRPNEKENFDFTLKAQNIILHDLGYHSTFATRWLFQNKILKTHKAILQELDFLLVRISTPILKSFYQYLPSKKIGLLKVSDYVEGSQILTISTWKKIIFRAWAEVYDKEEKTALAKSFVFTNSIDIKNKISKIAPHAKILKTSTLFKDTFYSREDTCSSEVVNLIYTGRIDIGKGLIEMVEALSSLTVKGYNLKLNFVGWEDDKTEPVKNTVLKKAESLNVEERIVFHGKKKIGPELNQTYRDADIYLMGSKVTEGFPRTIWEAMANSMPVVATKIGSIPYFLTHGENALLINPSSSLEFATQIEELLKNSPLRQKLIKNGYQLAEENTLEGQAQKLVSQVRTHLSA